MIRMAALSRLEVLRARKGMQHYAWFTEDSIIQLHGMGPQAITYVNPADDPRKGN